MAEIKKIGMAVGTFSVALGIGFVMQNGDALAARVGTDVQGEQAAAFNGSEEPIEVALAGVSFDAAMPQDQFDEFSPVAQNIALVPDTPEIIVETLVEVPEPTLPQDTHEAPIQLASIDPDAAPLIESPSFSSPDVELEASASETAATECVPIMNAVAGAAATVELAIAAPCYTDTAFTVHHQGMMFSAKTDEHGHSSLAVPALAEVAVVIAAFDHGDGAVATVTVPEFSDYDRAVLQWQGDTAVLLSAYENGAEFASENHIFSDNPGDITRVEAGVGGFLVSLGDATVENALMAEVYTYPTTMVSSVGEVTLVAEAEITEANCESELNAQSIQVGSLGDTTALDLTMVMPDCNAVGDVLILQNMFQDLTLAMR